MLLDILIAKRFGKSYKTAEELHKAIDKIKK